MAATGDYLITGGSDTDIRIWQLPKFVSDTENEMEANDIVGTALTKLNLSDSKYSNKVIEQADEYGMFYLQYMRLLKRIHCLI